MDKPNTAKKQVGCFNHRVVTLFADNWSDWGYERFALVLKTNLQAPRR